jgi:hypothetical protein
MIQFFLIALLVMAVISAAAILIAVSQGKRAAKAEKEVSALHDAFWEVREKAERLQKVIDASAKVEVKANEERKELDRTPDADLVNRANTLFGGVQDGGKRQ